MTDRPPTEHEDDDEALSWAGDRDSTPVEPVSAPQETVALEPRAQDDAPRTSSLALVTLGVVAGVYLLYTLAWITSVARTTLPLDDLFAGIMYQLGQFLAIASPALWFVASIVLTRDRKPVTRLLWVVAGLVVVAPWPFLLGR